MQCARSIGEGQPPIDRPEPPGTVRDPFAAIGRNTLSPGVGFTSFLDMVGDDCSEISLLSLA